MISNLSVCFRPKADWAKRKLYTFLPPIPSDLPFSRQLRRLFASSSLSSPPSLHSRVHSPLRHLDLRLPLHRTLWYSPFNPPESGYSCQTVTSPRRMILLKSICLNLLPEASFA
ncbi:unnamed protein product [Protopolystoma xenopodis]|uniref:Uncharacterized protein n=1 Tax=Protopolystoma xenopodis TaxID=117903 RepID=A0A3S5BLV6_9PLAT|nr:unnamed protein product [Protopolystoma xenopodis]